MINHQHPLRLSSPGIMMSWHSLRTEKRVLLRPIAYQAKETTFKRLLQCGADGGFDHYRGYRGLSLQLHHNIPVASLSTFPKLLAHPRLLEVSSLLQYSPALPMWMLHVLRVSYVARYLTWVLPGLGGIQCWDGLLIRQKNTMSACLLRRN